MCSNVYAEGSNDSHCHWMVMLLCQTRMGVMGSAAYQSLQLKWTAAANSLDLSFMQHCMSWHVAELGHGEHACHMLGS